MMRALDLFSAAAGDWSLGLHRAGFGDAVLPQLPEVIGRAIRRTEAALDAVLSRANHDIPGDQP
jgi:hypothetical protein